MNNNVKALKSGFWYIIANFVVNGMTLITTPIFTRLLTKEQYGDYSNFLSWTNIAIIVVTMRVESTLISAKYDYKDNFYQYNFSLIVLNLVTTSVSIVITNIFSGFFSDFLEMKRLYVNLMLIYCFFYAVINIFQMSERYQFKYKSSVFVAVLVAITTTMVSIVLVYNMQDRLTGRVLGGVLPTVAIGFIILLFYIRNGKSVNIEAWKYALKICIPYIPHLLSLQVLNSVDRIMITKICGSGDNALYSVGYSCGHMVTLLMTSMNNAFAPWLGDRLIEKDYSQIRKVSKYYMMLFCVLAIGMMLLAPEILMVMGGNSYLEAIYVIPPVAMGCVAQFIYTLFVNVEQFKKKTVGMAFASVAAALLNYILNAIFIPKFGYIAAAYTTLVGYLFLLAIHMILVKRIGYSQTYSYSFVITFVFVMIAIMIGINVLYVNPILRYMVMGFLFIITVLVLYINRKLVKSILKKIVK